MALQALEEAAGYRWLSDSGVLSSPGTVGEEKSGRACKSQFVEAHFVVAQKGGSVG